MLNIRNSQALGVSRCFVRLSGTRLASSSSSGEDDREFPTLQRAHSINSGVALSRSASIGQEESEKRRKSKVQSSLMVGDVHNHYSTRENVNTWRKRPLFARGGKNLTFTSGQEASRLLVEEVRRRDPYQVDFLQAVEEASQDVSVTFESAPKLAWVFKQLMEPERLITFRVPWTDDNGNARINRGYRIQYSSALGPYHGGIRFDPSLSHGSVRMLGWEQTMKNAVSGTMYGGARGGSDFDPTLKSEAERKRFCHSFMNELGDFVGSGLDSLATDIGVGAQEMNYLYESFEQNDVDGDDMEALFGSSIRFPEATGFGSVFFAEAALDAIGETLKGKRCIISGSGTLARSVATKLIAKGAVPVSFSDETGYVSDEKGFTTADINTIANITATKGTLKEYAKANHKTFSNVNSVWERIKGDIAFTCGNQNELGVDDVAQLTDNGCIAVFETSDRGCTSTAQELLAERGVLFAPSKAVSCGAVIATAQGPNVPVNELEQIVEDHMHDVHAMIRETAEKNGIPGNLRAGANLSAFIRIANSPMYLQK